MPADNTPLNVLGSAAVSGILSFIEPDSTPATPLTPRALVGVVATESAGGTASFRLHDGASASAPVLGPLITMTAHQTVSPVLPDIGVQIVSGQVYLEVVSGSFEGNIYWSV